MKHENKKKDWKRGRKRSLSDDQVEIVKRFYKNEDYNIRQLAEMFGVSRMAIWRCLHEKQK